ncbi:hypothetical protein [Terrisporobacter vanillatitrophus]|uniref:hypothetical protein n=1 Tax=Terrisporobacter vanillatitrophus TaxID=3058402 RepID=UPI003368C833
MLFFKKKRKEDTEIEKVVKDILDSELKSILHDVTYRLETLYAKEFDKINNTISKISSRDLNLASHMLDGYVIEDNKPTTGSIQWTDCNIVYKGVNYTIVNGSTNKKYVWWDFSATDKTVYQVSDTKPTLEEDDVLVFINDGGMHSTVIGSGKLTHGAAIANGSLSGGELKNGAIGTLQIASGAINSGLIASGAITSGKLGSGAVSTSNLAAGAVDANALGSGAVTSTKIGSGAVTSTAIASGAVGSTAIAANAVTATQLASGAVTSGKIGSGAVSSTNLASGAVTSAAIAAGAVGSTAIAAGAVTGTQIGAGAVASDKLNIAAHIIF